MDPIYDYYCYYNCHLHPHIVCICNGANGRDVRCTLLPESYVAIFPKRIATHCLLYSFLYAYSIQSNSPVIEWCGRCNSSNMATLTHTHTHLSIAYAVVLPLCVAVPSIDGDVLHVAVHRSVWCLSVLVCNI